MLSLNWITINKRLLEAATLINATPLETFTNILHIITSTGVITEDDLATINKSLQYSDDQLQLLVQSILHIYKKASLIVMKPVTLQKDLENKLKLNSEKSEVFVKVWTDVTKGDFGDLDRRKKLDGVAWSLNLNTHSSSNPTGSQILKPIARLQLSMSDFENKHSEETTLELDAQGLVELYKTLESVQNKLDSVNNVKS